MPGEHQRAAALTVSAFFWLRTVSAPCPPPPPSRATRGDSAQAICFGASFRFPRRPSVMWAQTRLLAGNEAALIKDILCRVSCSDDADESMITGFLIDSRLFRPPSPRRFRRPASRCLLAAGQAQHHRGGDRAGIHQPDVGPGGVQPPRRHLLHTSRHPLRHPRAHPRHRRCGWSKTGVKTNAGGSDVDAVFFSAGVVDEVRRPAHLPGGHDPGGRGLLQLPGKPGRPGGVQGAPEGPGTDSQGGGPASPRSPIT